MCTIDPDNMHSFSAFFLFFFQVTTAGVWTINMRLAKGYAQTCFWSLQHS